MDYLYMERKREKKIPAWIICIQKNPCADYVWIDGLFTDPPFMDGEKTNWHQLVLCSAVIRYYITSCVELSILVSAGDESCRTCLNLTLFICGITFFFFLLVGVINYKLCSVTE